MAAVNVSYTPRNSEYVNQVRDLETRIDKEWEKLSQMEEDYIKMYDMHDHIENMYNKLLAEMGVWHELIEIRTVVPESHDKIMSELHTIYDKLSTELYYAHLGVNLIFDSIATQQDMINELTMQHDDMMTSFMDSVSDSCDWSSMDQSDDEFDSYPYDSAVDWDDIMLKPLERKTRRDVMTINHAMKAHKSSKNHKLKPRSIKRDRTKTPVYKAHTKAIKMSHIADVC